MKKKDFQKGAISVFYLICDDGNMDVQYAMGEGRNDSCHCCICLYLRYFNDGLDVIPYRLYVRYYRCLTIYYFGYDFGD